MKIKDVFEIERIDDKQFMVCLDNSIFAGMVELNETADFIVECLKEDISVEEIAKRMSSEYEATVEEVLSGVEQIVNQLRNINAIEE